MLFRSYGIVTLHSFLFLKKVIIYELPWLGKTSGMISYCFSIILNSVFLLLDWMQLKPTLFCYLTHCWGGQSDGYMSFPRAFMWKCKQQWQNLNSAYQFSFSYWKHLWTTNQQLLAKDENRWFGEFNTHSIWCGRQNK